MKALRVTRGEVGARLIDVPVPVPRDDEVLIQVTAAGLCGTDVQAAYRPEAKLITRPELTLGHEPAGRIVALGRAVHGWASGDRVVVSSIVTCGRCHQCSGGMSEICARGSVIGLNHDGAVAEYMTAPAGNLVRLPDAVTDEVGAILTDAIPTPFHALYRRGRLQPGETLAVFGVGGLGQHAVQLAKAFGAARVIAVDTRAEQLEHARSLGADHAFLAGDEALGDRMREANGGSGVDMAGVFAGSSAAIAAAFRSVRKGGRVVVVGLTDEDVVLPPSASLARREVSIIGSGGFRLATIEQLMGLVADGRLDFSRSVSNVLGLEEAESALELLRDHRGSTRRVVVAPKGED